MFARVLWLLLLASLVALLGCPVTLRAPVVEESRPHVPAVPAVVRGEVPLFQVAPIESRRPAAPAGQSEVTFYF